MSSSQNEPVQVMIVEDHQIYSQGLQYNMEIHDDISVVGTASNGDAAVRMAHELEPDVIIMDINLPGLNGIQVTRQLVSTERLPIRVVMVTGYDDMEQLLHAMRAGAAAYAPKDINPDKLVDIIRQVYQGHYVVNNQVFDQEGIRDWMDQGVENIVGQYYADIGDSFSPLSPREMEILQYVTRGMSNKEIALELGISHQTVKNHMTSILRKLTVDDRTQAAVFALRRGWVRLRDFD